MKFLTGLLMLAALGCASYDNLSRDPPIAVVQEHGLFYSVRIIVENNNKSMWCAIPDASNEYRCTVGIGFLDINEISDWEGLLPSDARRICADGLWHAGASRAVVYTCSQALLVLRFLIMPPEEGDSRDR
jgi:hypothetical protein